MGCRKSSDKRELIRIVRTPEGEIKVDLSGRMNGRGAYLCKETACLDRALKTGALSRTLKVHIPEEIADELRKEIEA